MKKLKKFQKFALSTKQTNNVKGGKLGSPGAYPGTTCVSTGEVFPSAEVCNYLCPSSCV